MNVRGPAPAAPTAAGVPPANTTAMPFDGYFGEGVDTTAHLEKVLSDPSSGTETPAALILETVQGEGGLNVARIDWLKRLEARCNKRGIVLIVDDIQAGVGLSERGEDASRLTRTRALAVHSDCGG